MAIAEYDGLKVLDVPFPVWYVRPFRWIYRKLTGNRPMPEMSPKASRLYLGIGALVALVLIWMLEGFVNPLELFVDIPTYDTSLYGVYAFLQILLVLTYTSVILKIAYFPIRKEPKFFSPEGMLMWVIGAAVGMLADSIARLTMDVVLMPILRTNSTTSLAYCIVALVFNGALFFILNDSFSTAISVELVPLISLYYTMFIPTNTFFGNPLIRQLVITFVLSLIMSLIEKTGVIDKITKLCIKYFYTPRYMPEGAIYMFIFTIPFYRNYKKQKQLKKQQQG